MRGNERGFTLVELLVALAISALIATLAYAGISSAIGASAGMQDEVRRLADLQRALNIIVEDLGQVVPRASVNSYGNDQPAFRGGRYQDVLLEFTRGGVANPRNLARSELQRVRYVLDGGGLWRQWWTAVDRVGGNVPPQSALLLEGVEEVQLGFLAPAMDGAAPVDFYTLTTSAALWESDWSSARLAPDVVAPLPIAVDLRMTLANFGEVRRVVELP
jgi:general secretion pathway protein J